MLWQDVLANLPGRLCPFPGSKGSRRTVQHCSVTTMHKQQAVTTLLSSSYQEVCLLFSKLGQSCLVLNVCTPA